MWNAKWSTAACSAEHQGINLPGAALTIPALTEKDRKDLEFGLKHGVDLVAISFVRSASDVREVKQLILRSRRQCSRHREAREAASPRTTGRNF